jgi:hypothetical protein
MRKYCFLANLWPLLCQGSGARPGDLRGWSSLLGELGSCLPDGDRCCPLRSGRSWPGCGPDVAPPVTSLEGASRYSAELGYCADGAAQGVSWPTAVVRGEPSWTVATGTRGARPARTTLTSAGPRRSPARPEGEARPRRPLASLARAAGPRQIWVRVRTPDRQTRPAQIAADRSPCLRISRSLVAGRITQDPRPALAD